MRTHIYSIMTCGVSGQIGLAGRLPWQNDPEIMEICAAQMQAMLPQVTGSCIVMGAKTYQAVREDDPDFLEKMASIRTYVHPYKPGTEQPQDIIRFALNTETPCRNIIVAGGLKTWEDFSSFVGITIINKVPYTGPADTYMPPVLGRVDGLTGRPKEVGFEFKSSDDIEDGQCVITDADNVPVYVGRQVGLPESFMGVGYTAWLNTRAYERIRGQLEGSGTPRHEL